VLVGNWIPVKINKENRGVAYKLLIDLMSRPSEVLVQLAAIKSLQQYILFHTQMETAFFLFFFFFLC